MTPPTVGRFTAALAIARRDLVEFVRDRRTLFVTLLLPMVTYPIVALASALGLRTAVADLESKAAATRLAVAVSGADAQAFAERLREVTQSPPRGGADWPAALEIEPLPPPLALRALATGVADVWVEAPAGTMAALDGDGTATVAARLADSGMQGEGGGRAWDALVRHVADDALRRRAAAAGLPGAFLDPLRVTLAGGGGPAVPTSIGPTLAGSILVLLTVLTLTGAFYPAIDAIAGEKERGTIETLLMAPCSAGQIVLGKFLAVFAVTLATLAANALSIALTAAAAVRLLPQGMTMELAGVAGGTVATIIAFAGLASLAAATCLAVTTASKSGKEAQNTLTPVILLVSALAGTALLPGLRGNPWLALVPFAGQIVVSRTALVGAEGAEGAFLPVPVAVLLSLVSSAALSWLLLKGTALLLTDEDILFRGPDATPRGLGRPAPRRVPTVAQGCVPVAAGLAAVWYAQGIGPDDLLLAIPLHQAVAVVAPLVLALVWQRVDLRATLGLVAPGHGFRGGVALGGAALMGGGLFLLSAALLLASGSGISDDARNLSQRLLTLIRDRPWWVGAVLMALLPAVAEEMLYRGWTLAALTGERPSRARRTAAVVAQAALFAVAHLLPERMPATFALGLATGAVRVASGSLLPAIVLHAVHNAMPLALVALAGRGALDGALAEVATGVATRLPDGVTAAAAMALAIGAVLVGLAARRRGASGDDRPHR